MLSNDMATFRAYPTHASQDPGSQESLGSLSGASVRSNYPSIYSSEASQALTADTEMTSPTSPTSVANFRAYKMSQPAVAPPPNQRLHTPEMQTTTGEDASAVTSPMSIATPVNGHKRLASGEVKFNHMPHASADASRTSVSLGGAGLAGHRASEVSTRTFICQYEQV